MRLYVPKHRLSVITLGALILYILTGVMGYQPRRDATAYPRTASRAIAATEDTMLLRALAAIEKTHAGQSGFALILKNAEALRIRLAMIAEAEKSLDIQYYSIQDDSTDQLILEALLQAAKRGVRVRILIDDITFQKSDKIWALLNATPHIELRVFNPLTIHDQNYFSRMVNFLGDMPRLNKRMHNKLFITDNQLAVLGGRNLGDAYFGTSQDFNFRDADIFSAGPIVPSISRSFDNFWNAKETYPLSVVTSIDIAKSEELHLEDALAAHWKQELRKADYISPTPLARQLQAGRIPLIWADCKLAADKPAKVEMPHSEAESRPDSSLEDLLAGAHREFIAVSPYFIPGGEGMSLLKSLTARGVHVRILTNSLASTDVVAVHADYRSYRPRILDSGAELYELKPQPGKYPRPGRFSSSSRASLHTKVYIIDREYVVIGTFNLDPRSIYLNTEIALVIHSPELGNQLVAMFDRATRPSTSFHLEREGDSHLTWTGEEQGKQVHYDSEPDAGFWRSVETDIFSLMPWEQEL